MSGSITDSDACGNDWDNTWIPPTESGAEPSNLPIVWKSPWKKVDIILVDHSGQKEIISDETGCFVPVKFQYLITNRLRHLQTLIHKIQSLDVKSIQTRDELLEITTKTDVHLRASGEIATVLSNELEDIYLKMIQRFPFTCSIAEELFKGHLQIMMIRDESKVYIVGPSTCKTLICNTIDQFNSLISKESISFDEKWKRVAVGYLKTVPFLLQQYPTVSISTKEDAKEMLLEGTKSDVRNAIKELYNVISSVHVEQIPIDVLVGKLLLCPEASSLFSSILESQQMAVSWTIDGDSLTVVSKETIPAGIVHQLLIENFVVAGFSSKDNSPSAFINSEPFRDTVQRNKNALLVVEKESTGYKVASTKLIMRDLLHREHFCSDMVCESVQAGKSHSDIEDIVTKNRTLENDLHKMTKRYNEALAEIERLKSNSGSESHAEVKMKPTTDKLMQQECYTCFSGDVFQEDVTRIYTAGQLVRHQRQMAVPVFPTPEKSAVHSQGLHYGGAASNTSGYISATEQAVRPMAATKANVQGMVDKVQQNGPINGSNDIASISTQRFVSVSSKFELEMLHQSDDDKAEEIEADEPLEREKLQILRKFEFLKMMETKQPGFKAEITDDKIVFTGANKRTVKDAVNDFIAAMKRTRLRNLQLAHLKCLALPGVVAYVNACISRKKLLCHWFINNEEKALQIYTKDNASKEQVTDILTKKVGPIEFSKTKESQQVFAHSDLQTVLRKHDPYIVIYTDSEEMVICGPDFARKSIMDTYRKVESQKIASYKRQLSSEEPKFVKEKLGINNHTLRYFQKRRQKEWSEFLTNFRLKTEIDELGNVLVCGAAKDAREAVSKFSKTPMFSKMKWSCEVMCPEEVKKQLEKRTIKSLEDKQQCSIELETDNGQFQQQQIGQWANSSKIQKCHVVLVHSNAFEVAADVMLVPTNEHLLPTDISCDFFEKGKSIKLDEQKRKQVSKDVQSIYVSSHSGNLPCQMIAYFPIEESSDGKAKQKNVKKGLKDLFDAVEKGNFQSLVIPVKIASTVPETTFLRWFVEVFNSVYNSFVCLKQIYLSLLFTTRTENLVNVLNEGILQELDFYDFRSMIEYPSPGKKIGQQANISVKLAKGNLVDQKVDVIVNSCNPNLELNKGAISASINVYGGKAIQDECKKKWPDGIGFGQVIKTTAGNMDFKFVLHGCLPVWTPVARIS